MSAFYVTGTDVLGAAGRKDVSRVAKQPSASPPPDVKFRSPSDRAVWTAFAAAAFAGLLVRVGYLATDQASTRLVKEVAYVADVGLTERQHREKTISSALDDPWLRFATGAVSGLLAQEKWPDRSVEERIVRQAAQFADAATREIQVRE